jgi:hypothetical protein
MTAESTAPAALSWSGVTARRMARHALTEPAFGLGPAGIAGVLCGAHAQVLSAAELSIARRVAGATRADVRRALWAERTMVKTFGPRGTIHLLPTADLPMWTGALPALPPPAPAHPEGVRFTPGQADEVAELTVDELTEAIAEQAARGRSSGRWRRSAAGGRAGASSPARPRTAGCSASDRTGAAG